MKTIEEEARRQEEAELVLVVKESIWAQEGIKERLISVLNLKKHVLEVLRAKCRDQWVAKAALRSSPLPYLLYSPYHSTALADMLSDQRPMVFQTMIRGWCRVRALIPHFSSLEGRTPCLFFMGGGYSDPIEATVDSFCDLFESAAKANSLFDA